VTTDKSLGDDIDAYLPMLHRAEDRIDTLVQLIGDLLSLSRSEQAKAQREPELLDVEPAVNAALVLQAERLGARDITARAEFEPTCRRCWSLRTIST
jgi:signal transduction histidine kinase